MARKSILTYEQEVQIRLLYGQGGHSLRSLAELFKVSKSKIDSVLKSKDSVPNRPQIQIVQPIREEPSPVQALQDFTSDPVLFRIQKLTQIEMDIGNLSSRGTNPASLYKLQIEIHDQITALRKAAGEITEENEEQLTMMLEQAFIQLSPIQKEQIKGLFGLDLSNVVGLE